MRLIKKIAAVIAFSLVFALIVPELTGFTAITESEAATAAIRDSHVVLKVGESKKISVKKGGKGFTWVSSNNSVAKVTKKKGKDSTATITAKGEGVAVITATKGKKAYQCFVVVMNNVSVKPSGDDASASKSFRNISVSGITGKATIAREKKSLSAKKNMKLKNRDYGTVAQGGLLQLGFDDGINAYFEEKTEFAVSKGWLNRIKTVLTKGEMILKVQRKLTDDDLISIMTPNTELEVGEAVVAVSSTLLEDGRIKSVNYVFEGTARLTLVGAAVITLRAGEGWQYITDSKGEVLEYGGTDASGFLFKGIDTQELIGFNGKTGQNGNTDENENDPGQNTPLPDSTQTYGNFNVNFNALLQWEVVSNIDRSSYRKEKDGSVTFEAAGPDGNPVRFWGYDVELKEGAIVFHENGRIVSLDSIGRIFSVAPGISDPGPDDNWFTFFTAYNVDLDPHPKSIDRFVYGPIFARRAKHYSSKSLNYEMVSLQANFFGIGVGDPTVPVGASTLLSDVCVDSIVVTYEEDSELTKIDRLVFIPTFYGTYIEGEEYDPSREVYDSAKGKYTFYMMGVPDVKYSCCPITDDEVTNLFRAAPQTYNVSDSGLWELVGFKDASGRETDRYKATVTKGCTVTVKVGALTYDVPLPVLSTFRNARTMHDLVSCAFPEAEGELKALVIPIAWKDQPQNATDEQLDMFRSELGRVIDKNGTVNDYSGKKENGYSLSAYYDEASYGKLHISSFITDWYDCGYNFSVYRGSSVSQSFFGEVLDWLYKKYPDMDFSSFDRDNNGYFDSVIFLNAGEDSDLSFIIDSFEGAVMYRSTYGPEYAGSVEKPRINCAVNLNSRHFENNALLHEFAHMLGLIDYYDVTYSGISALGGYDMQDSNVGDWNAYSKYAVGWIDPVVVKNLAPGEHIDIEIGAMSKTGDAIVISPAGTDFDGPFNEYILVDLFTDCGVNKYDAAGFNLTDTVGVRIYHVDATMERRDYVNPDYPDTQAVPIGTIHFANAYNERGKFNIELIQAGKVNTFTDIYAFGERRTRFTAEDLFMAGDTFSLKDYSQFFYNGVLDFSKDFGYSISVVSITGKGESAKAVIRITGE